MVNSQVQVEVLMTTNLMIYPSHCHPPELKDQVYCQVHSSYGDFNSFAFSPCFSIINLCVYYGIHIGHSGIDDVAFIQAVAQLSICHSCFVQRKESIETGKRLWTRSSHWIWSRLGTTSITASNTRVKFEPFLKTISIDSHWNLNQSCTTSMFHFWLFKWKIGTYCLNRKYKLWFIELEFIY